MSDAAPAPALRRDGAAPGAGPVSGTAGAPEPLLRVRASPPRRAAAVAMLGALGGLLLAVALAAPPAALGWRLFLLAFGAAALGLAWRLWRATAAALVLTPEGLHDSEGREIAPLADIVSVERGMLAFKPSNGFLLHLARPGPRHWAPGLWWRLGRRVAVGGVTGAGATRAMADLIALRIAQRAAGSERDGEGHGERDGDGGPGDDQKHS